MLRRRNLSIAAVTLFCLVAVFGLGAIPSASADGCTVTITVAGGQQFTFQNVAPGTNPNSLPLPVQLPIVSVSQTCPPVDGDHAGPDGHDHHPAADDLDLDFNPDLDLHQAGAVEAEADGLDEQDDDDGDDVHPDADDHD